MCSVPSAGSICGGVCPSDDFSVGSALNSSSTSMDSLKFFWYAKCSGVNLRIVCTCTYGGETTSHERTAVNKFGFDREYMKTMDVHGKATCEGGGEYL